MAAKFNLQASRLDYVVVETAGKVRDVSCRTFTSNPPVHTRLYTSLTYTQARTGSVAPATLHPQTYNLQHSSSVWTTTAWEAKKASDPKHFL